MSKLVVAFIYLLFLKPSSTSFSEPNDTVADSEASTDPPEFYIVGGFRPDQSQDLSKYVVSLRAGPDYDIFGSNHFCGGTIIGPKYILTAAHCVRWFEPFDIEVVAATPNRCERNPHTKELRVKAISLHPQYQTDAFHGYDIAVLTLKRTLKFDNKTKGMLPLAQTTPPVGTECWVLGWGALFKHGPMPDSILHAKVSILALDECKKVFRHKLERGRICAADTHKKSQSCTGDSGGPLVCNGELAGIVSYVKGCAVGYPGVYTDVAFYTKDWLAAKMHAAQFMLDMRLLMLLFAVNFYCLF